jgi:glycosyltransferase involved in cell wall biosynthesis
MSDTAPIVSFILASHNYEPYVRKAAQSVLDQTVQNLELIIIDDASTDNSLAAIREFSDPRIRIYVNEENNGLAWTLDRGIGLARGEFIAFIDADDWIDRTKTEQQLEYFRKDPSVDIVSTYAASVDADGNRHALASEFEAWTNRPLDFNVIDSWVVRTIIHGTVMMRRSTHDLVGPRDPTMVLADYEYWTRALRKGCRFGLIQSSLLMRRRHGHNLGYSVPLRSFKELSYAMWRNLMPTAETTAHCHLMGPMIQWVMVHPEFHLMSQTQRYRMLGLILGPPSLTPFTAFDAAILDEDDLELTGRGKLYFEALSPSLMG